jgi:hypothetical protein
MHTKKQKKNLTPQRFEPKQNTWQYNCLPLIYCPRIYQKPRYQNDNINKITTTLYLTHMKVCLINSDSVNPERFMTRFALFFTWNNLYELFIFSSFAKYAGFFNLSWFRNTLWQFDSSNQNALLLFNVC